VNKDQQHSTKRGNIITCISSKSCLLSENATTCSFITFRSKSDFFGRKQKNTFVRNGNEAEYLLTLWLLTRNKKII